MNNQHISDALADDCLVRDVAAIFGHDIAHFAESSIVADLPKGAWDGVKTVLLLESPHKKEVRIGRPLVGSSGKSVTRGFRENIPAMHGVAGAIGDLIADDDPRVSWLGIMNASRIPLRASAYRARDGSGPTNTPVWREFSRSLRYVSGKRTVTQRDEAALLLECAIVKDLGERLGKIPPQNNLILLCCGEFAQRMFERTRPRHTGQIMYTPHPSRDRWRWEKYAKAMSGVYSRIVHTVFGNPV